MTIITQNKTYTHGREAYVISPLLSRHCSRLYLRCLITFFMFLPHTAAVPICLLSVGAIVKKCKWKKHTHTHTHARARTPEVNTCDPNNDVMAMVNIGNLKRLHWKRVTPMIPFKFKFYIFKMYFTSTYFVSRMSKREKIGVNKEMKINVTLNNIWWL